jgi:HD-like signal output (HDOD) protein
MEILIERLILTFRQSPRLSAAAADKYCVLRKSLLQGLNKIPPFPPIAARLLVLLSNEAAPLSEVAELIGTDPTFSARLLQCVNSVEFGLPSRVSDVTHALSLLGLDRTREATVTLATSAYASGALRTGELRRCWEHSVATAIIADQIARAGGAFIGHAYTAGIMHDIGRLGLLVAFPRDYQRIIRDAADRCLDLLDFERDQFGVHHAEAGRLLAERWNFPEELLIVTGRHHDPCEGEELDLLRIVHVACRMADALGYDITRPLIPVDAEAVLAELPERARASFKKSSEELRILIAQRIRAYDSADPEPNEAVLPTDEELSLIPVGDGPLESAAVARSLSAYIAMGVTAALMIYCLILLWR